ncbi:hypothetical protein [Bacteroides ihuae]|uniref:hypothetical protein n=1 Tax=Bacteroides ihuae TaxID=1852362 RepID=UPI0008DADE50|nr:hypothetical protein [Bacteroides ihuae]
MKSKKQNPINLTAALSLSLPSGMLDYFDLVECISQESCSVLFLEEKSDIPTELSSDMGQNSKLRNIFLNLILFYNCNKTQAFVPLPRESRCRVSLM